MDIKNLHMPPHADPRKRVSLGSICNPFWGVLLLVEILVIAGFLYDHAKQKGFTFGLFGEIPNVRSDRLSCARIAPGPLGPPTLEGLCRETLQRCPEAIANELGSESCVGIDKERYLSYMKTCNEPNYTFWLDFHNL